ncbi:MAG: hypothetical protein IV084_06360 [Rugosibacter sp.]|nr:hypothetical protein [Rugosibacter sp.]
MEFQQEILDIEKFVAGPPFRLTPGSKRDDLVDALYISARRSCTPLSYALSRFKTSEAFDEKFFQAENGNIYTYIREDLRPLAKRIFNKIAGGGTPNAAMGKGELLLLLFPENTSKPPAGDIAYGATEIEVKTNNGKVGIGSCRDGHAAVVAFCNSESIELPRSRFGRLANNQPRFSPNRPKDRNKIHKDHLGGVLSAWWTAVSNEKPLSNPTWEDIRKAFLKKAAEKIISPHKWLLVMDGNGNFQLFREQDSFVKYYDNDSAEFEYRAHHGVPFSIYLKLHSA